MRPKKHETTGSADLFRARLAQIINMRHELVQLAGKIDWEFIDGEIAPLYSDGGRPGIATQFVIGLSIGASASAASWNFSWPRACGWRTRAGRCGRRIWRGSRSIPPCSPRTSPSQPMRSFCTPLSRADQIRSQQQRQRGWKLYSFHAQEVECIGKGKASAPYEFGVKASVVTTNARAPGGPRSPLHDYPTRAGIWSGSVRFQCARVAEH